MMQIVCDRCKKPIPDVTYELRVLFNRPNDPQSIAHYHWDCLKQYMKQES
jgi:hypothetical protein